MDVTARHLRDVRVAIDPLAAHTRTETTVFTAYLVATLLATALHGCAAVANLVGHDYPKRQADALGVPRSWTLPLGLLLAAGSLGLLVGLWVPRIGVLAAAGLVLYFVGAFLAHVRARDRHLGPWAMFFATAVASLWTSLAYRGFP
jgi:DoxX-like protein